MKTHFGMNSAVMIMLQTSRLSFLVVNYNHEEVLEVP